MMFTNIFTVLLYKLWIISMWKWNSAESTPSWGREVMLKHSTKIRAVAILDIIKLYTCSLLSMLHTDSLFDISATSNRFQPNLFLRVRVVLLIKYHRSRIKPTTELYMKTVNGPMYFFFCRLYLLSVIPLLLSNTVSPVRICQSIWLERFRGTQKEDDRRPLNIQSSLKTVISVSLSTDKCTLWYLFSKLPLSNTFRWWVSRPSHYVACSERFSVTEQLILQ